MHPAQRRRASCLHNHGGGVGRLVLEVGRQHLGQAVVTREAVDAGLDENETELRVLVLRVRKTRVSSRVCFASIQGNDPNRNRAVGSIPKDETSSDPSVSRNRAASSGLEQSPLSARRYHPSFCKVWETTSTHSHERGITRLCALLIDETTSTRSDDYLAVLLKVLAHGDGLLDEAVEVLREGRGEAPRAEDAHDLVAGDHLDLRDAVGIPEDDANLRRGVTLLGHVADLLDGVGSGLLDPGRRSALVWEGSAGEIPFPLLCMRPMVDYL